MQVFDSDWNSSKEKVSWYVEAAQFEIQVSCVAPVELRGLNEDGVYILLHVGASFRIRPYVRDFVELTVECPSGHEFGYRVREVVRQDGEPLNNENPPAPPMPGQDNLLLTVKRLMRAEFDRNRAPYLEPEELWSSGRYQVDEDDERFEEELVAEAKAAREAAADAEPPPPSPEPKDPASAEPVSPSPGDQPANVAAE